MAEGRERRLGTYQLVAPLATGGMAELFIAKTTGVSGFEQVALKVIHPNFSSDPDFVRMLIDEAKLTVQLQHANIVQTYDLGQVDGQYYIAMELVDGADLYKVLKTSSERYGAAAGQPASRGTKSSVTPSVVPTMTVM